MEHLANTWISNDGTSSRHLKIKWWNMLHTLEDQMMEYLTDTWRSNDGTCSRHLKIKWWNM